MNNIQKFSQVLNEGISQERLADILCHRLESRYPDIYNKYDYDKVYNTIDDVASFHAGAEELGSSDISIMLRQVIKNLESTQDVSEGWKDKVAGAALGAAALGGIGTAINMSPNVTIQGQQARLAIGNVPENAKLVTTDDGKKVHVWSVRGSNPKSAGSHQELVYKPAEVKEQGVAEGLGPQKGDPVYYGSRLVGWFLGYSKYGKVITKPNYDEMGDEYANRNVYWDKDAVTIKSDKQGVAEEQISEMNPMLVRDGLQVVIDFLSQYPQATALTAGAAGTAIVAKLVKNAWRNHKELEQLKQDVRNWNTQKLHSNKNVSANGGKVAEIIQTEIERRKQGVAEGYSELDNLQAKFEERIKIIITRAKKEGRPLSDREKKAIAILKGEEKGMAEAKPSEESTLWRVEQSGATGRYFVVKGYQKRKVWKNSFGSGDFISRDAAQKKADELNGNVTEDQLDELNCWTGYKRVPGTKAGSPGSCEKINELSTEKLKQYKTAAAADAKKADSEGDYERGNKRFSGIVKATKKQFDNETKPKKESAIMKGLVDENLGTPYPGTYEQETAPFRHKSKQDRVMKMTSEGKTNVSRHT